MPTSEFCIEQHQYQLDREALEAAERMEFSSIERDRTIVQINITFTVTGSDN
jgi:hypothetical protein